MDGPNQWVQLSEDASCVQWSHLHPGPPAWGETGEDNEDLTRHIACCLDISTTPDPTPKPTAMRTPQPTEVSLIFVTTFVIHLFYYFSQNMAHAAF